MSATLYFTVAIHYIEIFTEVSFISEIDLWERSVSWEVLFLIVAVIHVMFYSFTVYLFIVEVRDIRKRYTNSESCPGKHKKNRFN